MSFNAANVVTIVRQAICFSPRMHAYKFLHRDVIDRWASKAASNILFGSHGNCTHYRLKRFIYTAASETIEVVILAISMAINCKYMHYL